MKQLEFFSPYDIYHAIKDNRAILVVEGISDIRCFERMIDTKKCRLKEAKQFYKNCCMNCDREKEEFNCRSKVMEVVEKYRVEMNTKLIAGIIDSDFFVDGDEKPVNQEGIFKTDTHDLETLIFKSGVFFEWMQTSLQECRKPKQKRDRTISFSDDTRLKIKENLLNCAKWVAIYRSVRDKKTLKKIKFDNIFPPFEDFIKVDVNYLPSFSLKDFIIIITEKYPENRDDLEINMRKKSVKYADKGDEWLWKICNGHDLPKILKIFIIKDSIREIPLHDRTLIKYKDAHRIAKEIIAIYTIDHFRKTNLCQDLISWKSDIFKEFCDT